MKEAATKADAEERKKKKLPTAKASKICGRIPHDNFGKVVRPADLQNALDKIAEQEALLADVTAELREVSDTLAVLQADYHKLFDKLAKREEELWQRRLTLDS